MATSKPKTLVLESHPNGGLMSLMDDAGRIWATDRFKSRALLREAATAAADEGYETIMIGAQSWDVRRVIDAG